MNDNRDPTASTRAGTHTIGDARRVVVWWTDDHWDRGWHWRDLEQSRWSGGPFDTSDAAYRAALNMLGG